MDINDPRFIVWLVEAEACSGAREWLATLAPCTTVADAVAACPRGEWLLWAAEDACLVIPEEAYRPAALRALRIYLPVALDAAGLGGHAAVLRALPDDVLWPDAAVVGLRVPAAAWAAAAAADARAGDAWAAVAAAAEAAEAAWVAARAGADMDAEHALCADDVRRAMPNLATALVATIGGGS